jgi:MFS family permease
MIGMERSIFPEFAASKFNLSSNVAFLSFIVAFGLSKSMANYLMGKFANVYGRKKILIFGWMLALPVPILLIFAGNWAWVVFANVLLGASQGFTWSSTIIMKIDLVGEKNRGLAMGLNEFAGYISVGLVAFLTSVIAEKYGIHPYPFYLGIFIAMMGLFLSLFFIKETQAFTKIEKGSVATQKNVFLETSFLNKNLSAVTQAGMINNLNDGMIWGLLPLLLISMNFHATAIGIIIAIYPTVWGLGQLITGKLADHFSNKGMLFWGMFLQGIAILLFTISNSFETMVLLSALLGIGTAMVYPTFLVTIAKVTHPSQRAESIGVFRLWRDLGYVIGALISGLIADFFGLNTAIIVTGLITLFSALIIQLRMKTAQEKDSYNAR